jgi:hypothetical protein
MRIHAMERSIFKDGARLLAATLAFTASAAFAQAQVDEKCMAQWNDAVATQAVGAACKVGDAASMARFKAAEDAALNCAAAKLSQAEATEFRTNAAKTKDAIAKVMSSEPCPAQAKSFFQQRAGQRAQ